LLALSPVLGAICLTKWSTYAGAHKSWPRNSWEQSYTEKKEIHLLSKIVSKNHYLKKSSEQNVLQILKLIKRASIIKNILHSDRYIFEMKIKILNHKWLKNIIRILRILIVLVNLFIYSNNIIPKIE